MSAESKATIELKVRPDDDSSNWITLPITVGSDNDDKTENNTDVARVMVHPDPNQAPLVTLDSPKAMESFGKNQPITFRATATDPDGSIVKVEFKSNGTLLGQGTTSDNNHFQLTSDKLGNGAQVIVAVATDSAGRRKVSSGNYVFVNGPIAVEILAPRANTVFEPGSDVEIKVKAINPSGGVARIEIIRNGTSLGNATPVGENEYVLKLSDVKRALYGIEAIASDDSGLISRDVVHITVSNVPKVTLVGPSEKAPLKVKSITEIQVDATELGGTIRDIEIYANDVLLEKGPLMQPRTYSFRWQPLRPGEYTLRAVAINEVGIRGESKTVHVVVRD